MQNSVFLAVFGRMQFTLHATRRTPHGASRLGQAMSAWLKTRRAPSRHSRDARVYGHTTAAMHKLSTPPTPPPTPVLTHGLRHHCQEECALEEATVLSRLSHSSIVRLLSFESLPSYHYLVLEVRTSPASHFLFSCVPR